MSRKQYGEAIATRDLEQSAESPDLATVLTQRYQRTRQEKGT